MTYQVLVTQRSEVLLIFHQSSEKKNEDQFTELVDQVGILITLDDAFENSLLFLNYEIRMTFISCIILNYLSKSRISLTTNVWFSLLCSRNDARCRK